MFVCVSFAVVLGGPAFSQKTPSVLGGLPSLPVFPFHPWLFPEKELAANSWILYSAKFLRRIIFAFFADWSGTVKIGAA